MDCSQNSYFSDAASSDPGRSNSTHNYGENHRHAYKSKVPIRNSPINKYANVLPVIFLISLILFFYLITLYYHLIPLHSYTSEKYRKKFLHECIIYHVFFGLFIISYLLCLFCSPGHIPDEPQWSVYQSNPDFNLLEKKKSGAPRVCCWCNKYKPDRAHHCYRCGSCVLKMDHHCIWTSKCVGWNNYKYFFLTLLYSAITLFYTVYIITPTTLALYRSHASFQDIFLVFVVNLFSLFLSLVIFTFLNFHLCLLVRNVTTLEYMDNTKPTRPNWDLGCYRNICSVLGSNPLVWLLPIPVKNGEGADGLAFATNNEPFNDSNSNFDDLEINDTLSDFINSNDTVAEVDPEFVRLSRECEFFKPIIDE